MLLSSPDGSDLIEHRRLLYNKARSLRSIVVDRERNHLLSLDDGMQRIWIHSLESGEQLGYIGQHPDPAPRRSARLAARIPVDTSILPIHGSDSIRLSYPNDITLDTRRRRLIVSELAIRLTAISLDDFRLLRRIHRGEYDPLILRFTRITYDHERDHIIAADESNSCIRILSAEDFAVIHTFPLHHLSHHASHIIASLCVIPHDGCILVSDVYQQSVMAYSSNGVFLSAFNSSNIETSSLGRLAFDEHSGSIAVSSTFYAFVIGPNRWLPNTIAPWSPQRHACAPKATRKAVETFTMLRSALHGESAIALLPNELLFEIFAWL